MSYETDSSMILGAEEAQSGVKLELSEGYFGGPEAKAVKATMEQFFQKLVADGENVAVTTEEKAKIGEEMKKPVGKGVFLSLLRQFVGKPTVCSSRENFAAFCDLVHQFLTILAAEKEHNNAGAVCIVLDVGRFVYLKVLALLNESIVTRHEKTNVYAHGFGGARDMEELRSVEAAAGADGGAENARDPRRCRTATGPKARREGFLQQMGEGYDDQGGFALRYGPHDFSRSG